MENRLFAFVWGDGYGTPDAKILDWEQIILDNSIDCIGSLDDMQLGDRLDLSDIASVLNVYRVR